MHDGGRLVLPGDLTDAASTVASLPEDARGDSALQPATSDDADQRRDRVLARRPNRCPGELHLDQPPYAGNPWRQPCRSYRPRCCWRSPGRPVRRWLGPGVTTPGRAPMPTGLNRRRVAPTTCGTCGNTLRQEPDVRGPKATRRARRVGQPVRRVSARPGGLACRWYEPETVPADDPAPVETCLRGGDAVRSRVHSTA